MQEHIYFYKQSLIEADDEIKNEKETSKALKDIIGLAYEKHRKRVWNYFGFEVVKDTYNASFNVDWSILYKGTLIAMEESKGHYLDSCFLERALTGFAKTVNNYQKNNLSIPVFIIHSFTKYNKFNDKKMEDLDTRKECIADVLYKKVIYSFMTKCDRLSSQKWFGKCNNCYFDNVDEELIIKDIMLIQSLIPQ